MAIQEFLPYIELDFDIESFREFCLKNYYRKEDIHKGTNVVPRENGVSGI